MKQLKQQDLDAITQRIVAAVHPEKIILFGSHAWGQPSEDSDIDIMVIVDKSDQPGYRRARDVYRSLRGLKLPVEVLVRTGEELARGMHLKTSLERKAVENGRVLHG
jgi:predicted nucleotidyltransferase